jgi:hypothetical protein
MESRRSNGAEEIQRTSEASGMVRVFNTLRPLRPLRQKLGASGAGSSRQEQPAQALTVLAHAIRNHPRGCVESLTCLLGGF